ncbi:uncharacterized protein SCHCODRAFT_01264875 [Schizophyllum commune H4-8]|uniref:uncharacterized protein n=1 Tax=Schizophyllum commune (strain H4-8 / FGSC 9210) TaxID=578458 RepID=UPI0021609A65|nr:uncharacterized protein SCHCODRAFT_01264875 [Schizophyllum commune H4-8]KAI5900654.1 hypothetical protein SCHCODRAFT_01264875 [Schizophyllum commune H4-8]
MLQWGATGSAILNIILSISRLPQVQSKLGVGVRGPFKCSGGLSLNPCWRAESTGRRAPATASLYREEPMQNQDTYVLPRRERRARISSRTNLGCPGEGGGGGAVASSNVSVAADGGYEILKGDTALLADSYRTPVDVLIKTTMSSRMKTGAQNRDRTRERARAYEGVSIVHARAKR